MNAGFPKTCCVCGRTLPSKYAVAGHCSADGCDAVFCALHWHAGNHVCPAHGGGQTETPRPASPDSTATPVQDSPMDPIPPEPAPVSVNLTVEQKRTAARAALDAIAKLGTGVAGLVKKLSGVQDPQEMIDSFSAALDANRTRREPLRERYDVLFRDIAAKKRDWQAAPPARKRILELELRTLLSEYQGIERQLTAYYENERTLVAVRTRVEEVVALEMRKVSERQIDRITDKLDDAVADAEDANDAVRDLENAGRRRNSEADSASLEDALAAFDLPDSDVPASAEVPVAPAPLARDSAAPAATPVPDIADLVP